MESVPEALVDSVIWMNGQTVWKLSWTPQLFPSNTRSNILTFITLSTLTPLVRSTIGFGAATHGPPPHLEASGELPSTRLCKRLWVPGQGSSPDTQALLLIFNLVKQTLLPLVIVGRLTGYHLCILAFKFLQTGVKRERTCLGPLHVGETGRRSL